MDLLAAAYGGDSDSEEESKVAAVASSGAAAAAAAADGSAAAPADAASVDAAPALRDSLSNERRTLLAKSTAMVKHNPEAAAMYAPVEGPAHPFRKMERQAGAEHTIAGRVEGMEMDASTFDAEYHTYMAFGYAKTVDGSAMIGDAAAYSAKGGAAAVDFKPSKSAARARRKRKRRDGRVDDIDGWSGPWAGWVDEERIDGHADMMAEELSEERKAELADMAASAKKRKLRSAEEKSDPFDEDSATVTAKTIEQTQTIFHGGEAVDFTGRSWIDPPAGHRDSTPDVCYIPKKRIHSWRGHARGVQAIRFIPGYGHLLLSAGMDGKVKIWDVFGKRHCKRSYLGHSAAVKDIDFTNDGAQFLSASFDRSVKLWDTETGTCLSSLGNGKRPYVAKFYPGDNNIFVLGTTDRRIMQYDCRSGEEVQVYDHHQSAVNTITFVEDARRFVSTSDDKKMLVWEWNIPVPIKYISDPMMQSIPAVTLHPDGAFLAGQSMDNNIVVYAARDTFRQHRKRFRGHVSGHACQIGFSPDGRFIMSGDGSGAIWFWDWKTTKFYRKLRAHKDGPCIGAVWHPTETSKVATCGWDGAIHLWD
eukprot:PLAT7392.1.p1 GENE.PLAT7392.1~~PLAT7392.1.p1  ORF type:complete len:589 (-),score=203.12 PLAT7392.1:9-1775(-)